PVAAPAAGGGRGRCLTGDPTDAIIIAVIVALSVGLGFVNEYRVAEPAQSAHDAGPHGRGGHRDRPALHILQPRPWLHPPARQLLPRPCGADRGLHGAGGRGKGPLLPGIRRTASLVRRAAIDPPRAASGCCPAVSAPARRAGCPELSQPELSQPGLLP